jgi:hypothetical protein
MYLRTLTVEGSPCRSFFLKLLSTRKPNTNRAMRPNRSMIGLFRIVNHTPAGNRIEKEVLLEEKEFHIEVSMFRSPTALSGLSLVCSSTVLRAVDNGLFANEVDRATLLQGAKGNMG